MHHVPLAFQCTYEWSDEGGEDGDRNKGRECRLPDLLYADDLVLCGELEDLRATVLRFVEVCRTRGLKGNAWSVRFM